MKQQLLGQNIPIGAKEYINAKTIASFKLMEGEIEKTIVTKYNSFVNSFESQYTSAAQTIREGADKRNKELALKGLDDLINIFKKYDTSVNLINTINGTKLNSSISVELADLLKIGDLINAINNSVARGIDKDFNAGPFSSALTSPSEALASMIDVLANQTADDCIDNVLKQVKASMTGTKPNPVTYTFNKGNKKEIISKSADFAMVGQNISLSELTRLNRNNLTVDYDLNVDSYATSKAYTSDTPYLNILTSYKGENSILMSELKAIYGRFTGNNKLIEYQIYNTIASYDNNSVLAKNFKIIKSDILCDFAEKFIAGFDIKTAQRIMVHNFTAYPILSIIAAIAKQGTDMINSGKEYGNNSIMGIQISRGGLDNRWIGEDNSIALKTQRVKKVKNFIDNISVSGKINFKNLSDYIDPIKTQGIPLQGIVPRLY